MSGNKVLFDTNAIIYSINGFNFILPYIHNEIYISEITEMELLGKKGISKDEVSRLQDTLSDVTIIDFNKAIKTLAIELKQSFTLKLPDAIIAATSIYFNLPLITADKQFKICENIDLILIEP